MKLNKPAEDPKVAESEKQIMPKAFEAVTDDLHPESHDATVDPMGVDPSSIEPPNPIKPVEEILRNKLPRMSLLLELVTLNLGTPLSW